MFYKSSLPGCFHSSNWAETIKHLAEDKSLKHFRFLSVNCFRLSIAVLRHSNTSQLVPKHSREKDMPVSRSGRLKRVGMFGGWDTEMIWPNSFQIAWHTMQVMPGPMNNHKMLVKAERFSSSSLRGRFRQASQRALYIPCSMPLYILYKGFLTYCKDLHKPLPFCKQTSLSLKFKLETPRELAWLCCAYGWNMDVYKFPCFGEWLVPPTFFGSTEFHAFQRDARRQWFGSHLRSSLFRESPNPKAPHLHVC